MDEMIADLFKKTIADREGMNLVKHQLRGTKITAQFEEDGSSIANLEGTEFGTMLLAANIVQSVASGMHPLKQMLFKSFLEDALTGKLYDTVSRMEAHK